MIHSPTAPAAGDWWLSPTPLSTRYVKSGRQRWDRMLLMSLWTHGECRGYGYGGVSLSSAGGTLGWQHVQRELHSGRELRLLQPLLRWPHSLPPAESMLSEQLLQCMAYSARRKSCVTGQVSVALLTERYGIQRTDHLYCHTAI